MKPKQKSNSLPLIFIGLGMLLLSVAAFWLVTQTSGASSKTTAQIPSTVDEVQRTSLKDAYAAYIAGSAVFLDVRSAESFVAGHIPGSVNISLAEIPARLDEISKDDWILIFCT